MLCVERRGGLPLTYRGIVGFGQDNADQLPYSKSLKIPKKEGRHRKWM
jgi:hypothetical protein